MQRRNAIIINIFCFLALASPKLHADTQTEAQKNAAELQKRGSDDSVDSAVDNAGQAFVNFANLNIPGAVDKGLKAYKNYKNSQKLDDMETLSENHKSVMNSTGNPMVTGVSAAKVVQGASVLRNFDRRKLYQGQIGATAAQLEELTGMKREQLFDTLVTISEANPPNLKDPQSVGAAIQLFKDFVGQMPNEKIRTTLETVAGLVPDTTLFGMAANTLAPLMDSYKNTAPPATLASGGKSGTSPQALSSQPPASSSVAAHGSPANASHGTITAAGPTGQKGHESVASRHALPLTNEEMQDHASGRLLASLISASDGEEQSLFGRVRVKYLKYTPGLSH